MIKGRIIRACATLMLPGVIALTGTAAQAAQIEVGDVDFNFSTTLSVAASVRTSAQDCRYISIYNGGCLGAGGTDYGVNSDDGDINVEQWEPISTPVKGISEVEATWRNYGVFVRGKAYYDYYGDRFLGTGGGKYGPVNAPTDQRRPLEDALRGGNAANLQARGAELLDAFVYGNFDVLNQPLTVRVGRQVVNWGESLFLPGGVSSYLPFDVAALTKPGLELKELYRPQLSAYASLGLPAGFTFEAMYIADWTKSRLPACGSFFAPDDSLVDGCAYALAGGESYMRADGSTYVPSTTIERIAGQEPHNQGQYGFALRYYADWLNQGTELATYFTNFHSNLPIGTTTASFPASTNPAYIAARAFCPPGQGTLKGSGCTAASPATDDNGNPITYGQAIFALSAGDNKKVLAQYPADIKMIGASFNTTANVLNGTAISGELAFYPNMPFQVDPNEIQAVDAVNFGYTAAPGDDPYYTGPPAAPGEVIQGYRRTDALHGQIYTLSTLTTSNPVTSFFDSDLLILIGNAGFQWVPDANSYHLAIPRSSETAYNPGLAYTFGDKCQLKSSGACSIPLQYATTFSWGYRLLGILQYNNAFGTPWTLSPSIVWSHDVSGYAAGPIGPGFVEGKISTTIGVTADYQSKYKIGLDYTRNFGNAYRNGNYDKNFASFSASYAF